MTREEAQRSMFGMTEAQLQAAFRDYLGTVPNTLSAALSVLSDAQEAAETGARIRARHLTNVAKWLILYARSRVTP